LAETTLRTEFQLFREGEGARLKCRQKSIWLLGQSIQEGRISEFKGLGLIVRMGEAGETPNQMVLPILLNCLVQLKHLKGLDRPGYCTSPKSIVVSFGSKIPLWK